MKKFIRIIVTALMLAALLTAPALTANTTGGSTTLTYTVAPTYTVSIPSELTLGDSAVNKILAIDIGHIEAGKVINVAITATSGTENAFTVCYLYGVTGADPTKTVPYTVDSKIGEGGDYASYTLADKVGAAAVDTDVYFQFTRGAIADNLPAGAYGGTVTFTVTYDAAA